MMNNEMMTKRIMELVAEGMDMKVAIAKVLEENKPKTVLPEQRVEWISSLNDLQELRDAIKCAFGKKSKSAGKPDKVAKYDAEVKAGQQRQNEILAEIKASSDPFATAVKYNESASGIVQLYLERKEKEIDDLKKYKEEKKLTNDQLKKAKNNASIEIPESIATELKAVREDVYENFRQRSKTDNRVMTVVRCINLLEAK